MPRPAYTDRGKAAERWQRAFNAPTDNGPYAKTSGPVNTHLLDGYRHELGSLAHAEKDEQFPTLSQDLQELVLHLISAHHGQARPLISTAGCDDAPPSRLEQRAGARSRCASRVYRSVRDLWGWHGGNRCCAQPISRPLAITTRVNHQPTVRRATDGTGIHSRRSVQSRSGLCLPWIP